MTHSLLCLRFLQLFCKDIYIYYAGMKSFCIFDKSFDAKPVKPTYIYCCFNSDLYFGHNPIE